MPNSGDGRLEGVPMTTLRAICHNNRIQYPTCEREE